MTNYQEARVNLTNTQLNIVSSPIKLGGGGFLFLKFLQEGGHEKLLKNRGLVERGGVLIERGVSKLFHQFPLRKACFRYYCNTFFCRVNIHTCCNQLIYSLMRFTFY